MMRITSLLLLSLLLSACASVHGRDAVVLKGVGIAIISEQPGSTAHERERQAMQASKLQAYQELAEQLYGVKLSSFADLKQGKLVEDYSQVRVQGVVKGAEVLRSYQLDGRYVTELRLDTARLTRLDGQGSEILATTIATGPKGPRPRIIRGY